MKSDDQVCEPTVFVVDDDESVRASLVFLIKTVHLKAKAYSSAQEFLDDYDPNIPGCAVLDVRMPGMSGLELQEALNRRGVRIPLIIVSGHGDVPMAVGAMKAGAVDFIEKPYNDQLLLDRIQEALKRDNQSREDQSRRSSIAGRIGALTPRERQVMEMVVSGDANKVIAAKLGVSAKTVEAHRAKVMEKMEADSLADLVRAVMQSGIYKDLNGQLTNQTAEMIA